MAFTKYTKVLTSLTVAVFGIVIVGAAYLGIKFALLSPANVLLNKQLDDQRKDLVMAERNNQDLKQTPPSVPNVPLGHQIVDKFQQESENDATDAGCRIDQFTSPATPGPYIPHYGNDAGGYSAFHIRMTVSGNLGRIFAMLRTLADCKLPFEFTQLGLTPSPVAGSQSSDMATANVEIDVLTKGAPT
jgi:hypothetical protein